MLVWQLLQGAEGHVMPIGRLRPNPVVSGRSGRVLPDTIPAVTRHPIVALVLFLGRLDGGCGSGAPPCAGESGVIVVTLDGISPDETTYMSVQATFDGVTSGFAGLDFSCPGASGSNLSATCSFGVDPPSITFSGFTDITTVNSVVLTLATQDGSVLADGVVVSFTSPVPTESSDSSEICERDGTLPN